jgi:hypothetical protein
VSPEPGIVHADDWLAVVDKPAGLVVHAAPGHRGETLVDLLAELLGGGDDPARPGIVHRLDKDTSAPERERSTLPWGATTGRPSAVPSAAALRARRAPTSRSWRRCPPTRS